MHGHDARALELCQLLVRRCAHDVLQAHHAAESTLVVGDDEIGNPSVAKVLNPLEGVLHRGFSVEDGDPRIHDLARGTCGKG